MLSPEWVRQAAESLPDTATFCLGLSGGMDSMVLLQLMTQAFRGRVRAVHVHHGLSANADSWVAHCQQLCVALKVSLIVKSVQAQRLDGSLEAGARKARYDAFAEVLAEKEWLVLAHHADDQVETVLQRIFRGTGIDGLRGMQQWSMHLQGSVQLQVWRPLLSTSRADIAVYAGQQGLQWVEDESNADSRFARNFLRNDILPRLQQHWPGVAGNILRLATHADQAAVLLDECVADDLARVRVAPDHQSVSLDKLQLSELNALPMVRRQRVLRCWFDACGLPMPAQRWLAAGCRELETLPQSSEWQQQWQGGWLAAWRGHLHVAAQPPRVMTVDRCEWPDPSQSLPVPGLGECRLLPGGMINPQLMQQPLTLRRRQGGERLRLPGRTGHHSLRKLYQEAGIPPWQREAMPLLYCGKQLIAVGPWVDADHVANAGEGYFLLSQ